MNYDKPEKDVDNYDDDDYDDYDDEDEYYIEEPKSKPVLIANNVDSNIFYVIGAATKAMREFGVDKDKIAEMHSRIKASKCYEEALAVIMDYVDFR